MSLPTRCRLLIAAQPIEAGVPRHVYDVVRLLEPAAYDLTLACPPTSELWHWVADLPHVRRFPIAAHREPAFGDAASLGRLARLVHRADVVHAHSAKAGFLTRLAASLRGQADKCVFTPHGWSFWSTEGVRSRLYAQLERASARWCTAIIAVSDYERRAGLARGIGLPNQYRVIRNGVDPSRFDRDPAPVSQRVLFVGRLAAPKRPDIVIDAVARLQRRFPAIELQIAGDGPARPVLEALVEALGVGSNVRFLGKRADIPELLSRASCLALASDYDACPIAVLEAKAAGVPVVASSVGGIPEIVHDGVDGVLVDAGCPEAMANGLASLLADPLRARAMGDAGRRNAGEQFTSQAMVRAVVAVYGEALARRGVAHAVQGLAER